MDFQCQKNSTRSLSPLALAESLSLIPHPYFLNSAIALYWSLSIWIAFAFKLFLNWQPAKNYFDIPKTHRPTEAAKLNLFSSEGKDFSFKNFSKGKLLLISILSMIGRMGQGVCIIGPMGQGVSGGL